jgi:hypothetical protein
MKDMYMKVHETSKGKIVAACDKELLGTVLDDGNAYLDLKTHRAFYEGDLIGEKELEQKLAEFGSANLVGKGTVAIALKLKLAEQKSVIYINKTPHIQIYRL